MNRAELVKTLELIKPALARTNMVPVFECFTFTNTGHVSAYDDTIAIIGLSELEESFGIHGNTLLGLLSNSSVEEVDISFKQDTATVTMGKSVSKLPMVPEENFIFKRPNEKWAFKMPFTESLNAAMKLCLDTVSTDTTQAGLQGITIQGDKMYSCNSDSLTRIQLKQGGKGRILMPTPFCEAVIRLWKETALTKGELCFNDEWVFADFGDWEIYGRVLEVPEPIDFEALIKKTIKTKTPVQALPENFSEALSRARVLADPESQKTTIRIAGGKLKMLTETHMGEIKDEFILKGHPDVEANVNAGHLQKAIESCDLIAFHNNCAVLERAPDVLLLVSNMS